MPSKRKSVPVKVTFDDAVHTIDELIDTGAKLAGSDLRQVADKVEFHSKCSSYVDSISTQLNAVSEAFATLRRPTRAQKSVFEESKKRCKACLEALQLTIVELNDESSASDSEDNKPSPQGKRSKVRLARGSSANAETEHLRLEVEKLKLQKETAQLEVERQRLILEQLRVGGSGRVSPNPSQQDNSPGGVANGLQTPQNPSATTGTVISGFQNAQQGLVSSHVAQSSPAVGQFSPGIPQSSLGHGTFNRGTTVKLPKLDMPKFNGDILKWQSFWDTFDATIHTASLTDMEKFSYLRSKLEGSALDAIDGLPVSGSNYSAAVDLLKGRFANKSRIISAHYSALKDLPVGSDNTTSLRKLLDATEGHLRALEGLGESTSQMYLVNLIQSKLPRSVQQKLEESVDGAEWSVVLLREKLQKLILTRENVEGRTPEFGCDFGAPLPGTTESLYVKAEKGRKSKSGPKGVKGQWQQNSNVGPGQKFKKFSRDPKCLFCEKKGHWSDECSTVGSLEERTVLLKGRCSVCLRWGHPSEKCFRKEKPCVHCEQPGHHRSLCPKKCGVHTHTSVAESKVSFSTGGSQEVSAATFLSAGKSVPLQAATLVVENPVTGRRVKTRMILDTGSQKSYITKGLSQRLGVLSRNEEVLHVNTFGSKQPRVIKSSVFSVRLVLKYGDALSVSVNEVDKITTGTHSIPMDFLAQNDSGLWKDRLADEVEQSELLPIDMLIGNDFYWDIVTAQKLELMPGLYLIWSKLGWIFGGRMPSNSQSQGEVTMLSSFLTLTDRNFPIGPTFTPPDTELQPKVHSNIKSLWDLDSLGIKESFDSSDDQKVVEHFKNTVTYEQGCYSVALPWKEDIPSLPDNYKLSLGRLKSLLGRLQQSPEVLEKYSSILQEQLAKGIIEVVGPNTPPGPVVHYIPHHAVVTPHKATTKVRIVYDGSARTKKTHPSINDCLYRGPIILEDLGGLLMRFRLKEFGVIADIEKAFLQVGIHVPDRDALRFLWVKNLKDPPLPSNLLTLRFADVPFGLICSPFLLAATVDLHLEKDSSDVAQLIRNNIYVDNIVVSLPSHDSVVNFYKETKRLFKSASMNVREWCSNDSAFCDSLPNSDFVGGKSVKVLGLVWDYGSDTLAVQNPQFAPTQGTKRDILKAVSAIFDPLSLFCPAILPAKLLLQKIWAEGYDWDDFLPEHLLNQWKDILPILSGIFNLIVPRHIGLSGVTNIQLHCFCDASAEAYGVAIYLRMCSDTKTISHLVFAKTRVAPAKRVVTIPRLELLAALIGVRSLKFVERELHFPTLQTFVWCDSQCALYWLKSPRPVSRFVDNRVKEIREAKITAFRYVNTLDNPADLASRGLKVGDSLAKYPLWWHGPAWLLESPQDWPQLPLPELGPTEMENVLDKKQKSKATVHQFHVVVGEPQIPRVSNFGLDIAKFSSRKKLFRVTAYVLRFVHNIRRGAQKMSGDLKTSEIDAANAIWDKITQSECFCDIQEALATRKPHPLVKQLGLELHSDGLIRCHGRMKNAELLESALFPKLLPKCHPYTVKVIQEKHLRLFHAGVSQTLAELRNEYWVLHGRSVVKGILRRCSICVRWEGKPFKAPSMPSFPRKRVSQASAFTYVGLDYFGPMQVKYGRQIKKVWVCIFTCLVVRAIHLEVVSEMSAEQFLLALQRLVGRRGRPVEITSDNAAQFRLASKTLETIHTYTGPNLLQKFLDENKIQWKFITEKAPWMGGFYERLISLVKSSLKKTIGQLCLTYDQLYTVLVQVESIVNSRPLVHVGDELESCLRPADFLSLNPKDILPISEERDLNPSGPVSSTQRQLLESWKKGQNHLNDFWNVWKREYLAALRERYQSELKQKRSTECSIPKVGDIVLISEPLPRARWRFGKIVEVYVSSDGLVRSASVLTPNGNILKRAIKMLYPLEIGNGD